MNADTPTSLSLADLELQLELLLAQWSQTPYAESLGLDQRMQVQARVSQLKQKGASQFVDAASLLGPLLCKSPEAQAAFRAFCAEHLQTTDATTISTPASISEERQPDKDSIALTQLQRRLRRIATAAFVFAALLVFALAGWSEWRERLCEWNIWAERFCVEVPITNTGVPPKTVKPQETDPRPDNENLIPIIESVVLNVRQPPLRFVRADLDPPEDGIFRSRWWLLGPPLIGLVVGWLYAAFRRRALEQQLSRLPTWRQQLDLIDLNQLAPLFVDGAARKAIAALQYRRRQSLRLDVHRTIDYSVREQFPTLITRERQVRHDYVFAVPMQTASDWRGQYYATLVKELQARDLQAHLLFYRHNPQELHADGDAGRYRPLMYWRQQFTSSTLVVLADAQTLFHPVFNNVLGWLPELQSWPQHLIVLTSSLLDHQKQQLHDQGYCFQEGFFSGDIAGLLNELGGNDPYTKFANEDSDYRLPTSLEPLGTVQAMTMTPDKKQLNKLIRWLKYRLGPSAFRLFCASVLFPRPDWRLTRGLAHRLADEPQWHSNGMLRHGSPRLLAPLARLPWCRHGYFPLWLRQTLYEQMKPQQCEQVSGLLRSFLRHVDQPVIDPMTLAVDTPTSNLGLWLRWARREGPVHDVLFANIINRSPLALLLDRLHLHNLHNVFQTALLVSASTIVAGVCGLIVWSQLPNTADDDELVARRCGLNQSHAVTIEYTEATQAQAEVLQSSLRQLCYQPQLAESAQPVIQSTVELDGGENRIQSTVNHEVLLHRAVSYALYGKTVGKRNPVPEQNNSVISLLQPITSGQVFRTSFLPESPLPLPEAGEAIAKPLQSDEKLTVEEVKAQQNAGEWVWPIDGPVTREFAPTTVGGQGVEIAGVEGQSIRAAMAGTVVYSGRDLSDRENLIIVRHDDSLMTTYANADKLYVAENDQVIAGDPMASLGLNANRESLVQFEVRENGNPLDPIKFLPSRANLDVLPDMVLIPAGSYTMGSTNGDADEQPPHSVEIAAFEMAQHELTWGEWRRCEEAGACDVLLRPEWVNNLDRTVGDRHPVVNVSWYEAQVYIQWLNAATSSTYRLPSEAEFEYALRAGSDSEYPWQQEEQCEFSNAADQSMLTEFPDRSGSVADCDDGYVWTAAVKSFPENSFELHDMNGNALEWMQDCYNSNYDGAPSDGTAWESGECDWRVLRGGGWNDLPEVLLSADRGRGNRNLGYIAVGFRLARTL